MRCSAFANQNLATRTTPRRPRLARRLNCSVVGSNDLDSQRPHNFGSRWRVRSIWLCLVGVLLSGCSGISLQSRTSSDVQTRIASDFGQAQLDQQRGKLELARTAYLNVLKLDPLNEDAYYDLGVVYTNAKNIGAAVAAYARCLIINPNYEPAIYNLAVLDSSSSPQTAVTLYQRIELLDSKNAPAYFNLGLLYAKSGEIGDAKIQIAHALDLEPALATRLPANLRPSASGAASLQVPGST